MAILTESIVHSNLNYTMPLVEFPSRSDAVRPWYLQYCLLDMRKKPVLTSFCLVKLAIATKVDIIAKCQMPSG